MTNKKQGIIILRDIEVHVNTYIQTELRKGKGCFHYVTVTNQLSVKTKFPKRGPTYSGQVVNTRHQRPQEQSAAELGTSLHNILVENTNLTYRSPMSTKIALTKQRGICANCMVPRLLQMAQLVKSELHGSHFDIISKSYLCPWYSNPLTRLINTPSPEQHGRHFVSDILKCMLLNEKLYFFYYISLILPDC